MTWKMTFIQVNISPTPVEDESLFHSSDPFSRPSPSLPLRMPQTQGVVRASNPLMVGWKVLLPCEMNEFYGIQSTWACSCKYS